MVDPSRVPVSGPLGAHASGLRSVLLEQGYTRLSARNVLYQVGHLSRWLDEQELQPHQLDSEQVERYLEHRRRSGFTARLTPRSLEPVLCYLRGVGAVPPAQVIVPEPTALSRLLDSYRKYLAHERGLFPSTINMYQRVARQFLSNRFGAQQAAEVARLTAADVTAFVLREARSSSIGYAKLKVTALRSLLRFLHVRGEVAGDLSAAVPAVAGWRLAGLPKALAPSEVRRLLRSRDRRTHVGRRDFAILLLMVRLGLRPGEVATLELDDIQWTRGELHVRGKGNRQDRLPLPRDVGEAVAVYLRRSRPRTALRAVFLAVRAPRGKLTRAAITALVGAAGKVAGLCGLGAHQLRHTAATQMLRNGVPLPDIGHVLRHRSLDTTAIYAKVDRRALSAVVRPWPGRRS